MSAEPAPAPPAPTSTANPERTPALAPSLNPVGPGSGASPTGSGRTVVPGVSRGPRRERLAFGAAGLGQLREDGLRVWSPDGGRADHPLQTPAAIGVLSDGSLVALGDRDGHGVLLQVGRDGAEVSHGIIPSSGRGPARLVGDPRDPAAFWLYSANGPTVEHRRLVDDYGDLEISGTVTLGEEAGGAVGLLPEGVLYHDDLETFYLVDARGRSRSIPWKLPGRVSRILAGTTPGTFWALTYEGIALQLDLKRRVELRRVTAPPTSLHLAADADGVAVLGASWSREESWTWTVSVYDSGGKPVFTAHEQGKELEGLALSADRVAAGDGTRIRVWDRKTGKELLRDG